MGAQLRQGLRIKPEVVASPTPFLFHQPHGLQDLQMLRHRGPANGKMIRQLADGRGLLSQQIENRLTRGVGERPQHLPSVSHT